MPMSIASMPGIQPELRAYLEQMEQGFSGDFVLVVTPATLGSSAAAVGTAESGDGFSRTVAVELQDANGDIVPWYNGTMGVAVSDTTAGNGVSAVADSATTVTLSNGVGSVDIVYTGTWAAADVQTTTISGAVLGKTLTSKTSVDTLVA